MVFMIETFWNNDKFTRLHFKIVMRYIKILVIFLIFSSYAPKKADEKDKILLSVIVHSLNSGHFSPNPINDDFSKKTFELYLKALDFNKKFLIKEDIDKLKQKQLDIDNEVSAGTFTLYDEANDIIAIRVKEAETYYKEILSKPFDFKGTDLVELDAEKLPYANDKKELKQFWSKFLKYQVMIRLDDMLEAQEKASERKDTSITIKTFAVLEAETREKVLKSQNDLFHRLNQLDKLDRISFYVNSIASTYDPHTNYFPPKEKDNFDIALSGQLEGIGATLQEKDGYIKVTNIVPGSASWKQGSLKVNDVILKVAQGAIEPVDIVNMRLDDAVKLVRGKKGTEVRLTVKKVDASIVVIPIIRDIVIIDETYAKSAIIKSDKKIGYIKLPQFYADFNGKGGRSSADDVRKEIAKLKSENVEGLIIDLRNNGGGSLNDAVDMGGLFIKNGPIVQIKTSDGELNVLEDTDPLIQYDGPLVIMVNTLSASASEILAAAIQDYKRGVIVGTNTFGKGTVQRLIDLDAFLPAEMKDFKPLGAVKLTTQKFYRINGGATQLKGVAPDVLLPDNYTYIEIGEKELEYPMPWDEIRPAKYTVNDKIKNLAEIKQKSLVRTKANTSFVLEDENAHRVKTQSNKTMFTLNLEKFRQEQKILQKESKKYEDIVKDIPGMTVFAPLADAAKTKSDSAKTEGITAWHKNIKKDMYIFESAQILKDIKP